MIGAMNLPTMSIPTQGTVMTPIHARPINILIPDTMTMITLDIDTIMIIATADTTITVGKEGAIHRNQTIANTKKNLSKSRKPTMYHPQTWLKEKGNHQKWTTTHFQLQ